MSRALTREHTVVLFANEPPAYRDVMGRAVAQRTGLEVESLPAGRSVEEGVADARTSVVVTSGPNPPAIRLSERAVVVHLTYEPREGVAVYRDGTLVREEALDGLGELAALIEDVAPTRRA